MRHLEFGQNQDLITVFRDAVVKYHDDIPCVFIYIHAAYDLHEFITCSYTEVRLEESLRACTGSNYTVRIEHAC